MMFASLVAVFLIAFVVAASAAVAAFAFFVFVAFAVESVVVLSVAGAYFSVVLVAIVVAKPYLIAIRVDSDLPDSRTGHHSN